MCEYTMRTDGAVGPVRSTYDKVLVTGGAGFIGSHTVDALIRDGVDVWALDDLSTGLFRNLKHWKNHPRLHFRLGSVAKYKTVEESCRKVNAVIHLAALVSPDVSLRKPELTQEVNILGTLNVLRAGVRNKIQRIVFASSSSVYGQCRSVPTSENACLDPLTPYGVSKLAAERYCRVYSKIYDLNAVSLRYFNVYGERQSSNPYSGVIAVFARRLLEGSRPTIYGSGYQTRDFIHVSDVVNANVLALSAKQGKGDAFNIGTGCATSIRRLYNTLCRVVGRTGVAPAIGQSRAGDISSSCANVSKARRVLGFEAGIALDLGLKLLVESFRS